MNPDTSLLIFQFSLARSAQLPVGGQLCCAAPFNSLLRDQEGFTYAEARSPEKAFNSLLRDQSDVFQTASTNTTWDFQFSLARSVRTVRSLCLRGMRLFQFSLARSEDIAKLVEKAEPHELSILSCEIRTRSGSWWNMSSKPLSILSCEISRQSRLSFTDENVTFNSLLRDQM